MNKLLIILCCITTTTFASSEVAKYSEHTKVLLPEQEEKIMATLPDTIEKTIATNDFKRLKVLANLGIKIPEHLQELANKLLFTAAHNGVFEQVKIAIKLGGQVCAVDEHGNTPIMKIIHPRREDVETALNERFKAAEYLLAFYGPYLEHTNKTGKTIITLIEETRDRWKERKQTSLTRFLRLKYTIMIGVINRRKGFNNIVQLAPLELKGMLTRVLDALSIAIIEDVPDLTTHMDTIIDTDPDRDRMSGPELESLRAVVLYNQYLADTTKK